MCAHTVWILNQSIHSYKQKIQMIFLESSLFLHFFFFSFFTQTILAGTLEVPETNKQNFNKKHMQK